METLLDASYATEDDSAQIELFYLPKDRSEDKRTVLEKEFHPYLYALPRDESSDLAEDIKGLGLDYIKSLEIVAMTDFSKEVFPIKITLTHPKHVPDAREKVTSLSSCLETREDDIRFVQRYLIDKGLVPMQGSTNNNLRIAAFDIETVTQGTKTVPIIISYADNTGLRRAWNYDHASEAEEIVLCADETAMIQNFIQTVTDQKIDIIVTYNGDNFDFGVLKDRCKELKIPFALGAGGREVKLERRGMDMGARVTGRPHVDLYPVCRRMFYLPRYTLEDVHLALFEEEKADIEVEHMAQWWKGGENIDKILEYSISDVDSALSIAKETLPTQYELSKLIGQPIYEVTRMGTGNAIEWLLMRNAHKKKILIPSKPSDKEYSARRLDRYEGAYVVDPKKGIHDNIFVFDFRSLYPSIIIAHNIDASTINCECCKEDAHVAPTGVYFCKKKKGLIPELLDDILKSRQKTKTELKRAIANGDDKTKIKSLDARQQALKILANSAYGYMGFSRARWYNNDCAGAVAAWGREYIKNTISSAKQEGYEVVYGDTDSLMLTIPRELDKKEVERIKQDFLKKINSKLPEAMELEFEGFYMRGVFVTKKRYALMDKDRKLTIKGLETKRRDWANIAKTTQEEVLSKILWENNPERAAEVVKGVITDLRDKRVPLKELLIYTQITKPLGSYENVGPHVQAARKAQKRGKTIRPGDVIQYIITRKGNSISDKAEMVGFVEENDYDAEYYINNQVLPAVMRILEALGYEEDELKGMGRQTTLSSW